MDWIFLSHNVASTIEQNKKNRSMGSVNCLMIWLESQTYNSFIYVILFTSWALYPMILSGVDIQPVDMRIEPTWRYLAMSQIQWFVSVFHEQASVVCWLNKLAHQYRFTLASPLLQSNASQEGWISCTISIDHSALIIFGSSKFTWWQKTL